MSEQANLAELLEGYTDESKFSDKQREAWKKRKLGFDPKHKEQIMYGESEIPLHSDEGSNLSIYDFSAHNHKAAMAGIRDDLGTGKALEDEELNDILERYVIEHVKRVGDEGKVAASIYDVTDFNSEDERRVELIKLMAEHLGIDLKENQEHQQLYQRLITGLKTGEKGQQIEALDEFQKAVKSGLDQRHEYITESEFRSAFQIEAQRSALYLKELGNHKELPQDKDKFQELYQQGETAHKRELIGAIQEKYQKEIEPRIKLVKDYDSHKPDDHHKRAA